MADEIDPCRDRAEIALERWDVRTRAAVRRILSAEVIEEHRRDPRGYHSDILRRVLDYFRRSSRLTPYVVICTRSFREWRVARLSGTRREPPVFIDERTFNSEAEAIHMLFMKRVDEIMKD